MPRVRASSDTRHIEHIHAACRLCDPMRLQERARAIIERRPNLERFFED
jgi:hypothetical protein